MADENHTILDGKVHIYRRERSRNWQCATYLGGRNHRQTTRQSNLAVAIEFARDWYMDRYADERLRLRGALSSPSGAIPTQLQTAGEAPAKRLGRPKTTQVKIENPFREVAAVFLREVELITQGERSETYVLQKSRDTYISMRLMEGADIYQIAKNCRTSVEMIETFYAAHIKNVLDAAAINRRKPQKPKTERSKARAPADA